MFPIAGTHIQIHTGKEVAYRLELMPDGKGVCHWQARVEMPHAAFHEWFTGSFPMKITGDLLAEKAIARLLTQIDQLDNRRLTGDGGFKSRVEKPR